MRGNRHYPRGAFRDAPDSVLLSPNDSLTDDSSNDSDALNEDQSSEDLSGTRESDEIAELVRLYTESGPTRKTYAKRTVGILSSQKKFWVKFCRISNRDPDDALRAADVVLFKAYLAWRVKHGRIKKLSTIQTYWKTLSLIYAANALVWMEQPVLSEINNFITQDLKDQFHLSLEPRAQKSALYVEDLDLLLTHHWILDTEVFPHERMRLQLAMILIIAGATSTRPGALLELRYGDIEFALFPSSDGVRPRLTMTVRLKETKRRGGKRTPTAFGFHEEINLIHCPVVGVLALALADDAFIGVKDLEQVYQLRVPANKDRIRLTLRSSELDRPIFRDMGLRSDENRPYEYAQARSALVRLGRSCGYEDQLMFYDLRRASGRLLTKTVLPEERNQIMGHSGGTSTVYRQYYMPEFVDRDVQSIYFGSTPQDDLIRAIGRIPRNGSAPTKLTNDQKDSIKDHPELLSAITARDQVTEKLRKSFGTIRRARQDGTAEAAALLRKHSVAEGRVHSLRTYLRNECLGRSIKEFHTSADDVEVRQQNRTVEQPRAPTELPGLSYELEERRQVSDILHQCADPNSVADLDGLRIRLVDRLAALAQMRETPEKFGKRRRHDTGPQPLPPKKAKTCTASDDPMRQYQSTFRFQPPKDMGCPFCRQETTYGLRRRAHTFTRIDSLGRHIFQQHFTDKGCIKPDHQLPREKGTTCFTCPYTGCLTSLLHVEDFVCHAQGLHGIGHFPRSVLPDGMQVYGWRERVRQFDGQ